MAHQVLPGNMMVNVVQAPPAFLHQSPSDRAIRQIKRENCHKILCVLKSFRERNRKYRQVLHKSKAHRVAWMKRAFGVGSLGFRHRGSVESRVTHVVQPRHHPMKVGVVEHLELTKRRLADGQTRAPDRRFECVSNFFGDLPDII